MQAAIDGGFNIVEFTLTTPGCLDLVADFRKKYDGKIMIGCGTIMDIEDAQNALDAYLERSEKSEYAYLRVARLLERYLMP